MKTVTKEQMIFEARDLLEPGEERDNPEYLRALCALIAHCFNEDAAVVEGELCAPHRGPDEATFAIRYRAGYNRTRFEEHVTAANVDEALGLFFKKHPHITYDDIDAGIEALASGSWLFK